MKGNGDMKRFFALLLSIAVLLSCMSGCSSDSAKVTDSTKVPDSQIELDIDDVVKELDWDFCVRGFETTFDHYDVAQHTFDDDIHTDSVEVEVYYSSWCCTLMFSVTLIYQYSRDNDLWTLIRNEVPYQEYESLELSTDLPDLLVGRSASATETFQPVLYLDTTIDADVSIECIDLSSETMTLVYCIDQYTQGTNVNHLVDKIEVELSAVLNAGEMYYPIEFDYALEKTNGKLSTEKGCITVYIGEDTMRIGLLQ